MQRCPPAPCGQGGRRGPASVNARSHPSLTINGPCRARVPSPCPLSRTAYRGGAYRGRGPSEPPRSDWPGRCCRKRSPQGGPVPVSAPPLPAPPPAVRARGAWPAAGRRRRGRSRPASVPSLPRGLASLLSPATHLGGIPGEPLPALHSSIPAGTVISPSGASAGTGPSWPSSVLIGTHLSLP